MAADGILEVAPEAVEAPSGILEVAPIAAEAQTETVMDESIQVQTVTVEVQTEEYSPRTEIVPTLGHAHKVPSDCDAKKTKTMTDLLGLQPNTRNLKTKKRKLSGKNK